MPRFSFGEAAAALEIGDVLLSEGRLGEAYDVYFDIMASDARNELPSLAGLLLGAVLHLRLGRIEYIARNFSRARSHFEAASIALTRTSETDDDEQLQELEQVQRLCHLFTEENERASAKDQRGRHMVFLRRFEDGSVAGGGRFQSVKNVTMLGVCAHGCQVMVPPCGYDIQHC